MYQFHYRIYFLRHKRQTYSTTIVLEYMYKTVHNNTLSLKSYLTILEEIKYQFSPITLCKK